MIERSNPLAEELPSPYDVEMRGNKYVLHTLTSPFTSANQMSEYFLNEVDALISNETFSRGMDVQKVEVSKEDFERKMDDGQIFDSATHAVVYAQISAIKNNPVRVNNDIEEHIKKFFKKEIEENPGVANTIEHMFEFNIPTAEVARIIVNMTPSLAQKVIDQREIKSMNIEHMKPNNIIDRAAHYINGDAVIKDIQNKAPEHKTGMILHELIIDGESYTAELFIDHDEMFIGTPDNGDIGMSIEAIAVYGYTCLLYTSPSPRDRTRSRMPSSA